MAVTTTHPALKQFTLARVYSTNKSTINQKLRLNISRVTIFFIFKMDKDGNGTISLTEYFAIFEEHGIKVNQAETNR